MITIPKGNTFNLIFPFVQKNYDGSVSVLDTSTLTDISVTLIRNGVSYAKSHEVSEQGLLVSFPASMKTGVYSVIIKAKVGENNIQSNIRNAFQITDWNEETNWQNHIANDTFTAEPSLFIAAPAATEPEPEPEPEPQDEVVATFQTEDIVGRGGFDGITSGNSIANELADLSSWEGADVTSNFVYKGSGCLKLGTSSNKGLLEFGGIRAEQEMFLLKFKAVSWNALNCKLKCSVTVDENESQRKTEFVLITTDYIQQYGFIIDYKDAYGSNIYHIMDMKITFESNAQGDRIFIGDIQLIKLADHE